MFQEAFLTESQRRWADADESTKLKYKCRAKLLRVVARAGPSRLEETLLQLEAPEALPPQEKCLWGMGIRNGNWPLDPSLLDRALAPKGAFAKATRTWTQSTQNFGKKAKVSAHPPCRVCAEGECAKTLPQGHRDIVQMMLTKLQAHCVSIGAATVSAHKRMFMLEAAIQNKVVFALAPHFTRKPPVEITFCLFQRATPNSEDAPMVLQSSHTSDGLKFLDERMFLRKLVDLEPRPWELSILAGEFKVQSGPFQFLFLFLCPYLTP